MSFLLYGVLTMVVGSKTARFEEDDIAKPVATPAT